VADWLVEPRLNTVARNGTTIHIEPKVMAVLVCLAQHAGQLVTKEELLQAVWPETFVTDDVLKRSISELRRAFEDERTDPRFKDLVGRMGRPQ
jgi:DNA-binding winged helix-turn-helix (wHTH) protein